MACLWRCGLPPDGRPACQRNRPASPRIPRSDPRVWVRSGGPASAFWEQQLCFCCTDLDPAGDLWISHFPFFLRSLAGRPERMKVKWKFVIVKINGRWGGREEGGEGFGGAFVSFVNDPRAAPCSSASQEMMSPRTQGRGPHSLQHLLPLRSPRCPSSDLSSHLACLSSPPSRVPIVSSSLQPSLGCHSCPPTVHSPPRPESPCEPETPLLGIGTVKR